MDANLDQKRIDRVGLACVQCRSRHVKCDATQPVCNRCQRAGKDCDYQKSRRGGLSKAALAHRRLKLQQETERLQCQGDDQCHKFLEIGRCGSNNTTPSLDHTDQSEIDAVYITETQFSQPTPMAQSDRPNFLAFQINNDRLMELYYENFWPQFPIVLPLQYLQTRRMNQKHGLETLLVVLEWIGSIYAPWAPSEPYYKTGLEAINTPALCKTPFNVQALILFAVAQHHSDFKSESRKTLDLAISIALELRMNERGFAQACGEADPVLEEAWRRTYYFLQIIDQHFSIVLNSPISTLAKIPNTVDLPCDDEFYEAGRIPPVRTSREYQNREFAEVEVVYSSIAYFWDLSQIVAYIMNMFVEMGTVNDDLILACDTKVVAWQRLLPLCKSDPLRENGQVDEVMFMAHFSSASVLLAMHRLFSSLAYSTEELSTKSFLCLAPLITSPISGPKAHTTRAIKALDIQTRLLAIPCAVEKHNVFVMYISARLATAQISACNNLLDGHAQSIARDRIRLSIGFLKATGAIWPLGKKIATELQYVARSTLIGVQNTVSVDVGPTSEIEIPLEESVWPITSSSQTDIYSGIVIPTTWDTSNFSYSEVDFTNGSRS